MKIGKVSESVLKRTIIKEIKHKRKDIKKGAAVGCDGTIIEGSDKDIVSSIATYSGDFFMSAKRAFASAVNSLSAKGGSAIAVMVSLMIPEEIMESDIRAVMVELNNLCEKFDLQIAGGHTESSENVKESVVTITALGYMEHLYDIKEEKNIVKPGMNIVMTGAVGLEGTAALAIKNEQELSKRFITSYINKAKSFIDDIFIIDEAKVAVKHGVEAMHDISKSGVFGALWELGEYYKCGMNIDLKAIPIFQETVEICEFFDLNPYVLGSSGGLLIVTDRGELLVEEIRKSGKRAEIIGYITDGHDKIVTNGDEKRFLEPPKAGSKEYRI